MYGAVYTPATLNPEKQHPTQSWIGPGPVNTAKERKTSSPGLEFNPDSSATQPVT
jgi:hypothetical protein